MKLKVREGGEEAHEAMTTQKVSAQRGSEQVLASGSDSAATEPSRLGGSLLNVNCTNTTRLVGCVCFQKVVSENIE